MDLYVCMPYRIDDLAGNAVYEVPLEFVYKGEPGQSEIEACEAAGRMTLSELHKALAKTPLGSHILTNRDLYRIIVCSPHCEPVHS